MPFALRTPPCKHRGRTGPAHCTSHAAGDHGFLPIARMPALHPPQDLTFIAPALGSALKLSTISARYFSWLIMSSLRRENRLRVLILMLDIILHSQLLITGSSRVHQLPATPAYAPLPHLQGRYVIPMPAARSKCTSAPQIPEGMRSSVLPTNVHYEHWTTCSAFNVADRGQDHDRGHRQHHGGHLCATKTS
jgi:hypothetical protein